jgi:hypothetical protein
VNREPGPAVGGRVKGLEQQCLVHRAAPSSHRT